MTIVTRIEADYLLDRLGLNFPPGTYDCMPPTELFGDPSEMAVRILEKFLGKPIYICAQGETSILILDENNQPITTPVGHRRGELSMSIVSKPKAFVKNERKQEAALTDNRILIYVAPNPKRRGSMACDRYETYTIGKSISWHYKNAKINQQDVRWDCHKQFIRVVAPAVFDEMRSAGLLSQEVLDAYTEEHIS